MAESSTALGHAAIPFEPETPFAFTCPHCQRPATVTHEDYDHERSNVHDAARGI